MSHAPLRRQLLQRDGRALADAFELRVPELRHFDEDPREAVTEARRTVRQADAPREGLGLVDEPAQVVSLLRRLFDEDSPTPGLLERARELDAAAGGE